MEKTKVPPEKTNLVSFGCANGIIWASSAGVLSSLSSICGKLAFMAESQTWLCHWFGYHSDDVLMGYSFCEILLLSGRACNFTLLILFSMIFWTVFSKALVFCSSSAEATVISTAINFCTSGLSGKCLFGEALGLLWWGGAGLIIIGLALIHKGSHDMPAHAHD